MNKNRRGYVLLMTLVFFGVSLALVTAMLGYVFQYSTSGRHALAVRQAVYLAEAGVDEAAYQLNQNAGYAGETDTALGAGTFTTSVTSIDANTKAVTVISYVPNRSNPVATRTIQAKLGINSSVVSFRFGVQVGDGGVTLGNGAQINGNLFSNGSVIGSGGSTGLPYITGDVTVAGGTAAAADQSWTTQTSGTNLGDVTTRANIAQSFKPSSTQALNKVSLYLKKTGVPSDITLKVVSDNAGKPSTTVLATGSVPASSVSSGYAFIDGTFTATPTLTSGQTYWLIAIASVNSSNYFTWGTDTADGYTLGTAKSSSNWSASNPTWAALNADTNFKTWMGGTTTSLYGVRVGGSAWASALSSCQIVKDATYQTISSCTVGGTSKVSSVTAAPAAMPIAQAQIDDWEAIAESGGTIQGDYSISGTQILGPKKINGNLTVNGTLYMTGPIWVVGNVTFANNSGLIVHASTGANGAVIIADSPGNETTRGIVTLSNNMTIAGNGNAGSYPMVLSTNSGSSAISMNNNATSVILYAPNGTVTVSNNAAANQITAKTLNLSNGVSINYVNGLQSQSFSNGPGGSWVYIPGSYAALP